MGSRRGEFTIRDRWRRGQGKWQRDIVESATNARLDQLARSLATARDEAEEANKAKSRFLTGMTHELRTPLHGVIGYAELLRGCLETRLEGLESLKFERIWEVPFSWRV